MSDKVCCQQYEIDYKKVVQEIQETLDKLVEELKHKLQDEKALLDILNLMQY